MERMERVTINSVKRPTLRESIKIDLETNLKGALALTVDKFAFTIPKITRFFDVKMQPINKNKNKHRLTLSTSDVNIDFIVTIEKKPNSNYLKVMEIR